MRKIKEVLRLKQTGLSNRAIARACAIGKETVREYLRRAAEAGLGWPLPDRPYEPAEWKRAKVGIDYHVQYQRHYYSVPYEMRHKDVDLRVTEQTVEIFFRGERIASHLRDDTPGYHTTWPGHMPASHRAYLDSTPERFIRWAEKTGPATSEMVRTLLVVRAHPEQGYRSALGLMRLESRYGNGRLEDACRRALHFGLHSYRGVKNILDVGLDRVRSEDEARKGGEPPHPNIRGRPAPARPIWPALWGPPLAGIASRFAIFRARGCFRS